MSPSAKTGPSAATAKATPPASPNWPRPAASRQRHRARRTRRRARQQHPHPRGHPPAPLRRRRAPARTLLRHHRQSHPRRPTRPPNRLPHRQSRRRRAIAPPRGVYAVRVRVAGNLTKYRAVLNLGNRPTFTSNGTDSLEVHLLDFDGRPLRPKTLSLRHRLAPQRNAFPDAAALKAQITEDIARARAVL